MHVSSTEHTKKFCSHKKHCLKFENWNYEFQVSISLIVEMDGSLYAQNNVTSIIRVATWNMGSGQIIKIKKTEKWMELYSAN